MDIVSPLILFGKTVPLLLSDGKLGKQTLHVFVGLFVSFCCLIDVLIRVRTGAPFLRAEQGHLETLAGNIAKDVSVAGKIQIVVGVRNGRT